MYFRKYWLQKTWLDKCLKSPVSEDFSTSNMVNGPKHCWNLHHSIFIFLLISVKKPELKKSLLVICKILGLFLNTLAAYDKYSLLNRNNFTQSIEMKLSKKQKIFPYFFLNFWQLNQILNKLKKKMKLIADVFSKSLTSEDLVR